MGDNREGKYETQLTKAARQSVPDPGLHNDGVYDAASALRGEKELLGEGISEGLKDDNYPSLPAGAPDGTSDVNYGAVAPYKYPEFGDWPRAKSSFTGALD